MPQILVEDFARLVGAKPDELSSECSKFIADCDTRYTHLEQSIRDQHILMTLRRLHEELKAREVAENQAAFERGWSENLSEARSQGVSLKTLRPKYVKALPVIRLNGDFVAPNNPFLFDDLCTATVLYLFRRYMASAKSIYEFGCGTGRYLFMLGKIDAGKKLVGLDWTKASQGLLELIAESTGLDISGRRFDMLSPPTDFKLDPGAAVLTVGAMEQLGTNHGAFLEYLISNKPQIVVHQEPIMELYGNESLYDYLALRYHTKRNYLNGYLTALRELSAKKKVEILCECRTNYGDAFNDGSSTVVWRPL